MDVLVPMASWIPEDDLLLKDALEAGASFEALARGAIRFSRRFTIQELQSRWHDLLYDPDTSEPASVQMAELELSAQSASEYKGNEVSGKRKDETVRSHYYAMRKRIRSEPFSNVDLSFLDGPTLCSCQEQAKSQNDHSAQNCNIGNSIVDHFDLHENDFSNVNHAFPQVMRANTAAGSTEADAHAFHSKHQPALQDGVEDMGPPQELPGGIIFEPVKSLAVHQLEYSSPGPTVPIWRTMEDISTPSALNNELDDRNKGQGEAMVCSGADDKQISWGYDVLLSDPHMEERTSEVGLKNSGAITDGDFSELESSLFNFTNSVLFMDDDDGKDMMDRSCLDGLSSILLSSPSDVHQDDIPNIAEHRASLAMELGLMIPDAVCPGELDAFDDKVHYGYKECEQNTSAPSSLLAPDPHSPERRNGVICCTLNTEDPDIPCNDDAFLPGEVLPPFVSPGAHRNSVEDVISFPPTSVNFSCSVIDTEQGLNHAKEEKFDASGLIEPQFLPAISPSNQITCAVTSELPEGVLLDTASRRILTVEGDPSQCGSSQSTPFPISLGKVPVVNEKAELVKFRKFDGSMDFVLENAIHCSDQNGNDPQKVFSDHKQEAGVSGGLQNHLAAEHGSFEMPFSEPAVNSPRLDQEVHPLEDDNDVPHFSDIEALILDMDLCPWDQDSCTEVSRYQHEEAKRAILRLDQGTHAYMQRAILTHRAFAIFYGRRLKHYIRKREVSIGRATDDTNVDIDLAKEGRANRISRRQATLKMLDNGSFSLKNLSKYPIVVNGKEVATGRSRELSSGCLIEIKNLSFIFEANNKLVHQYLADTVRKNQHPGSKFE